VATVAFEAADLAGSRELTRPRRRRGTEASSPVRGEEQQLHAGQITDDDLLRFFTVYETVGMLG
jgi:hypothetical protein